MAFKYELSLQPAPLLIEEYVVENGQTVQYGDLVQLANGVVRAAASAGTTWVGLCVTQGASVGDALGTVTVKVQIDHSAVYAVGQGALADAAVQPGDLVDINAGGDALATAANNDFRVFHHDAVANIVFVQPVAARLMYH
jgi:hypothetical protein